MAHVADGERRRDAQRLAEHRVPGLAEATVEVLPREHGDDARQRTRFGHVELGDRRLGHLAAQERGMQRAGQAHVVDVEAVTGQEPTVLLAPNRLADVAGGGAGRGHRHTVLAFVASAATRTARRMPW